MMENEKPFFSIVIPTYNHGHLIKRCLDSIVAQTYIHWEAIVVNNYSNDNTVEIVESYRIRVSVWLIMLIMVLSLSPEIKG